MSNLHDIRTAKGRAESGNNRIGESTTDRKLRQMSELILARIDELDARTKHNQRILNQLLKRLAKDKQLGGEAENS